MNEIYVKRITNEVKGLAVSKYGKNTNVEVQAILKDNGVQRTGITIREEGSNICPTIYLETLPIEDGESVFEIAEKVMAIYEKNRCCSQFDMSWFNEYENVRNNLTLKLVNKEKNAAKLDGLVWTTIAEDMAAYAVVKLSDEMIGGNAGIAVPNDELQIWNVSKEQVLADAMENLDEQIRFFSMEQMMPPELLMMYGVKRKNTEGATIEEQIEAATTTSAFSPFPMVVVTNKDQCFGASAILSKKILILAQKIGTDLYILPSSKHECIVLPDLGDEMNLEELKGMVGIVNQEEVREEDFLSNSVYKYSLETGNLQKVA